MTTITCSICLDDKRKDKCFQTECGHLFDPSCLSSWINNTPTCPLCRTDIDPQKFMLGMIKFFPNVKSFLKLADVDSVSKVVYINLNNNLVVDLFCKFLSAKLLQLKTNNRSPFGFESMNCTQNRALLTLKQYSIQLIIESDYEYYPKDNSIFINPNRQNIANLNKIQKSMSIKTNTNAIDNDKFALQYTKASIIKLKNGQKVKKLDTGKGTFFIELAIQECISKSGQRACGFDKSIISATVEPQTKAHVSDAELMSLIYIMFLQNIM